MSLNIKNERTHALVRELATLRGVSQTEAVEDAVKKRLAQLTSSHDANARYERTIDIAREMRAMLEESGATLSTDDLYDEIGLPR